MRAKTVRDCVDNICSISHIGRVFSAKRLEAGLQVEEVEALSGVCSIIIRRFEAGDEEDLALFDLIRLAESVGVSIDALACQTIH